MKLRSTMYLVLSLIVAMTSLAAGFAKTSRLAIANGTAKAGEVSPSKIRAYEHQADDNNKMLFTYHPQSGVMSLLIKRGSQLALYQRVGVASPGSITLQLKKHHGGSAPANEIKIDLKDLTTDSASLYLPDQRMVKLSSIEVKEGECSITPIPVSNAHESARAVEGCICMLPGYACSTIDPTGGPREPDWWACFYCCAITFCCKGQVS